MKPAALVLCSTLVFSLVSPANSPAAESALLSVLLASKSIVSIKSEAGGIFGDKEHGVIRPMVFTRNGAGVILDPSGIIVANAHTVQQAGRITVTFFNNTQAQASIAHVVAGSDIAFLKVTPPFPLEPLGLSDSDQAPLGTSVYTIGNSPLLQGTINGGEIRGIGTRKMPDGKNVIAVLQVDFGLYQGDSGCPVLDGKGKLLGIIAAQSGSQPQLTFAIPVNEIKKGFAEFQAA